VKRIWYDPDGENNALFRSGQADWVSASPDRVVDDTFGELPISVNTYWGLLNFGIVDRLAELPTEYLLGPYEEGVLSPAGLGEAARILREAAAGLDKSRATSKSRANLSLRDWNFGFGSTCLLFALTSSNWQSSLTARLVGDLPSSSGYRKSAGPKSRALEFARSFRRGASSFKP
jgi:hypothetical protein